MPLDPGVTTAADSGSSPVRRTSVGRTPSAAMSVVAEPITSSKPRLHTPRWYAMSICRVRR